MLALGAGLGACRGDAAQAEDRNHAEGAAHPTEQERFDRERRPDLVVAALGLAPGKVVADIGAGTGLLTSHLARAVAPNGRVVATDVDGAVLDMLAARMDEAGLAARVERRVVGPDDPGLEPATYDAILLSQVDHYFSDPVAWLRTAIKAMKPQARLVISNRIHHRRAALAAAEKAGLHLVSESTEVPGQFIAVYTVEAAP